jgi:hippurate hydrolase
MNTLFDVSKGQNQMKEWRRHIHQHPETAFEEVKTAEYVASLLTSWGYDVVTGIGRTGVVASLSHGSGESVIGLRADMDALPVTETADIDYKSQHPGKMHACGHDGHTAMLLGAARFLSQTQRFNGTVRLIFQPAEEAISGAPAMIEDGLLEKFPMDAVFGLHNMPGLPQGTFHFREGPMMAAVDNWQVTLTGKGSHGSMPEKSIDPVVAGASIVMALQTVVARNVPPLESAVVTVGAFQAGDAGNVIPQTAVLRLSIRSLTQDTRELVLDRVKTIIQTQAACFGVDVEINPGSSGEVLENDPSQTRFAAEVASDLFGPDKVFTDGTTYMGSEDFAFFSAQVPGCYCMIGNGDTPMVHHPAYRFDDRNLSVGAAFWVALVESFLK